MSNPTKHICKGCGQEKVFRADQLFCSKECSRKPKDVPVLTEQNEVTADSWNISLPKTRIHTLDQLIDFFEIDLTVWSVRKFVCNKWEVGAKGPEDKLVVEPLFQVKAFLEKKVESVKIQAEISALKELAKSQAQNPPKVVKPKKPSGTMLEINLTDHHFGKLAWGAETGYPNYDVKIATAVFHRALETLLARAPYKEYSEIWFVVGNDLFNNDDTIGRTTSGTQVESDVRHEKTYTIVRTLLVQAIERLRTMADKIKVLVVPGNHDHNATWHLGDSLECYFAKYEDVEVDNRPCSRKYHVFGNTLIMFTHGDKGKLKDMPLLMAAEQSQLFGQTKFHEIHSGHIHTKSVTEQHGIRVRTLSALCPPDSWHSENGYVGNLRESEAFVWDKVEGLTNIIIYTDSDELIN